MRVSRERLSVIGKLIGIYREEKKNNTQNEYTQKRFCEGVCSPNTLKSIEAGGLSRSEDIYIELLDKLGLKYGEFPAIDTALDELMDELYKSIEFYDIEQIKVLCEKAMRILYKVQSYVYYSGLYHLLHEAYEYYCFDKLISDKDTRLYKNFLNHEIYHYRELIVILVYAKLRAECILDVEEYRKEIDSLELEKSMLPCLKLNLLHYYLSCDRFIEMKSLLDELEHTFYYESNFTRLLDTYNCAIVLSGYVDKVHLETYIEKVNTIIAKHAFPNSKVCEVYNIIASAYHVNKQYDKALACYEKMCSEYKINNLTSYLYMADCQNRLGKKVDIPKFSKEQLSKFPVEIRMMYKYFTLEDDVPFFVKQNFLMKKIAPYLKDNFMIEMFRFELNKLIKETGHYKNMYLFDSIVEKNLRAS